MRPVQVMVLALIVGCSGGDAGNPSQITAAAGALPGEITNSIGMRLQLIPAGEFLMGSPETEANRSDEEKQHRVRITKPFYLGIHEVTRGQFAKFVTETSYQAETEWAAGLSGYGINEQGQFDRRSEYTWRTPGFSQTDDHPVVNVSWNDAGAFIK